LLSSNICRGISFVLLSYRIFRGIRFVLLSYNICRGISFVLLSYNISRGISFVLLSSKMYEQDTQMESLKLYIDKSIWSIKLTREPPVITVVHTSVGQWRVCYTKRSWTGMQQGR